MARKAKINIGVLNITTHPHSPERYIQLFKDVSKLNTSVVYRGSDNLQLGYFGGIGERPEIEGIWGNFYIYVNIDNTSPVLNLDTGEFIVSKEGEITFPIPEHLKPNLRSFEFVFLPHGHRLFLNCKSKPLGSESPRQMSTNIFSKALYRLLNLPELRQKYGEVNVFPETQKDMVEKILQIPSLEKLEIAFTMPNGDDCSDEEQRLLEKYNQEKIKKVKYSVAGDKKDGLSPVAETQAMMHIAVSNGGVYATGRDGRDKIEINTVSHPVILSDSYTPKTESSLQALHRNSINKISEFTNKN